MRNQAPPGAAGGMSQGVPHVFAIQGVTDSNGLVLKVFRRAREEILLILNQQRARSRVFQSGHTLQPAARSKLPI